MGRHVIRGKMLLGRSGIFDRISNPVDHDGRHAEVSETPKASFKNNPL
jgi:hypothetical protein